MFISFLVALGLISTVLCAEATPPIRPAAYRQVIKQGFATNWFKTAEPLSKYHAKNIEDIYLKGFRNVRLRSRADLYSPPYNSIDFAWFLGNLTVVVDKCLETGVARSYRGSTIMLRQMQARKIARITLLGGQQ